MKHLLLILTLFSCSIEDPNEEEEFKYNLQFTTFKTRHFKSFDSEAKYAVFGLQSYYFDTNELTIDHSNYSEQGISVCTGDVNYTYTEYEYDQFYEAIDNDGLIEEEQDFGSDYYDVFSDIPTDEDEIDKDEKRAEVIRKYFIGTIEEDSLNPSCPLTFEDTFYFQINLFRDGDLEFYNHNRKIMYFARPN